MLKITRPQLKQIIKEELLTEKDECHPQTVSSGWIDDEGVYTPLQPGENHRSTAVKILKDKYGKKRRTLPKWGAEAELVRQNWIKVSNWLNLYGLKPSQIPSSTWIKQYMTIITKTSECEDVQKGAQSGNIPVYYVATGDIVGSNSLKQGADTVDRYYTWLRRRGTIAQSMTAQFRENLKRIVEEELKTFLNERGFGEGKPPKGEIYKKHVIELEEDELEER